MIISSLKNQHIVDLYKLHNKKERDAQGLFLVENWKIIKEGIDRNLITEILTTDTDFHLENSNIKITYITQSILEKLSSTKTPQNIIAVCKKTQFSESKMKRVVVLDQIQDPGNLGTIMRNAVAFGFDTIVIQGVDVYNEKTVRSSQGALFYLNILQTNNLEDFFKKHQQNYQIIGTIIDKNSKEITEIKTKNTEIMVVFGNEGNGISDHLKQYFSQNVYIKINFESLNVAAASAIILNHLKEIKNA
ncbi:TrmH family RNA methyltransferase [Mycoplasma procyoni]|uniref:TrmH family RNA methyltransferase n=1 Tax=Mycoplasma procyoni TaxID=568784 RepID=UPI00197B8ABB|nr:RNA methyltransferase [Mycoplasma procyoni]MBN3534767.1 RNA methyltransferase [Mycoplasma procyoni]